jgi:hypothetical protein
MNHLTSTLKESVGLVGRKEEYNSITDINVAFRTGRENSVLGGLDMMKELGFLASEYKFRFHSVEDFVTNELEKAGFVVKNVKLKEKDH